MKLTAIACQNCQGHGLDASAASEAVCRFCGAVNPVDGVICPRCDFVAPAGADACANCRQTLSRRCPDCATANWIGAEQCANCGRALDALTHISSRYGVDPANFLNELSRGSAAIKAVEAADSQVRMGRLEASEQRRQAALTDARRLRDGQQRTMALGFGAIVVVAVAVIIIMVMISLGAN